MHWWHAAFHVPNEAADAVAGLLQEFPDIQGVQLEGMGHLRAPHPEYGEWFDEKIVPTDDVEVSVYFPDDDHPERIRTRILAVLDHVSEAGLRVNGAAEGLHIVSVDDSTWMNAWKEYYEPIPVGSNLLIVPVWNKDDVPDGLADRKPIILEPGMAFGTGTHQTTQMCAEALVNQQVEGKSVLDVGTGTGILAIAAARLDAGQVRAIDIDPVAVRAAKENVEMNALAELVSVEEGNLLAGFASDETFDVIIANILRDIVILLLPQAALRQKPGGHFLCSGFIDTQAPAVEEALTANGYTTLRRYQKDDWMAIAAVKD